MNSLRHLLATAARWCIGFSRSITLAAQPPPPIPAPGRGGVPLRGSHGDRLKAIHQLLLLAAALPAAAGNILTPSTITYGGVVSGGDFFTGNSISGFSGNGWPAAQGPGEAVDGVMGQGSKYLNFGITNTALIFSGTTARVADRLDLWVAEDFVERDPASYILYGTNTAIPALTPSQTFALSNFTQISTGTLALPASRDLTADAGGFSQSIPIPNTTAYASYLLVFPTVKGPAANSMQISEVQLYDPEIIGVDQFDYPDGPIANKNGGTFWNWKNQILSGSPAGRTAGTSDWDAATAAPAVASGRLVTQNSAAQREYNGPGENLPISTDEGLGAISAFNNGTLSFQEHIVYYRVTVTTGATLPDSLTLTSSDFGTDSVVFGKLTGGANFAVSDLRSGSATTTSSTALAASTTYTLVARLDFGNGTTGTASLFLNPDLNAAEPAVPLVSQSFNSTFWSSRLKLASTGTAAVTWDDLVIATSWDSLGTVVTTLADEDDLTLGGGAGVSLREAVKYSPTGSLITFAPGLSGQTCTLTHADGDMPIPGALTIDASALPGGFTVDGNNASRHFQVAAGKSLTLRGLTFTRGSAVPGGAISSSGALEARDCSFRDNTSSGFGGGIFLNSGTAALSSCTFSANTASSAGALWMEGTSTATLSHCTVTGNRGFSTGGIAALSGTLNLQHCTVSQNTGNGGGGGLYLQAPATVNIANSLIAGNTDTSDRPDIFLFANGPTLNATGANLIGSNESVATQFPAAPLVGTAAAPLNPKLSPLGYFGGPVQTMHPLIGSPAIDAAGTTNPGGTDARGFPRFVDGDDSTVAQLDIGAVEAGPLYQFSSATDGGLRSLLTLAGQPSQPQGIRIRFNIPGGSTITLGGTELTAPAGKAIFLDASNLTAPVTVSGNNQSRVFNIPATATVAMHSVRIVGGKAPDGVGGVGGGDGGVGANGGGILNAGSLSLFSCTISGNAAGSGGNGFSSSGGGGGGGGISSVGSLSLFSCTVANNRSGRGGDVSSNSGGPSGDGGGISSRGSLLLAACTLSGNATGNGGNARIGNGGVSGDGGGIFSQGPLTLTACTLSGNTTGNGGNGSGGGFSDGRSGDGAAIRKGDATPYRLNACTLAGNHTGTNPDGNGLRGLGGGILGGTVTLQNCLIAQNTAFGTAQDVNVAGLTTMGANLLGTAASFSGSNPDPAPIINANPLLAPLGDYGGPTQTMPPRPGSPAIDAATATTAQTDQRGFPRSRDGDGNGTAAPDIGAVEASLIAVTIPGDSGAGSLRAALTEAAAQPGPEVIFFTAAVTPHITLASEILITDTAGVTLDASDRPTGLVIDAGPGTNRHFRIDTGATAIFQRLRLYGGNGTGGETTEVGWGGSIRNQGTLTLRECTITDCTSASEGGAIYNGSPGALTIERSTLHGNAANGSGAILHWSAQPLTITHSTIANNTARFQGGAINSVFTSPVSLTHCTITGNAVTQTGASGVGGVRGAPTGFVTVRDCIIAGNTDANSPGTPNINTGFIAPAGSVNLTSGNPNLATLGDYGGPTWTMPPMPGSPAIDAALSSTTAQTDQRGAPRLVDGNLDMDDFSDIGAVESPAPLTVTTTADENNTPAGSTLSLREAIRDAAAGATILFDSSFNGEAADKITLSQALGEIAFTKGLIVNASANPGGVTIDGGPGTNRIFYLPAGTGAYLQRLTLTGGNGAGQFDPDGAGSAQGNNGGAIHCFRATLALADCTLSGNTAAPIGGAIFNYRGTLTLDRCLLTGNSTSAAAAPIVSGGGAIHSFTAGLPGPVTSSTTLTNCTLSNNSTHSIGGGIHNLSGRATLLHCTVTGNTAAAGLGSGISGWGTTTFTPVQNCLIAGNHGADDVRFGSAVTSGTNTFFSLGGNLIGSGNATGAFNQLRDATGHTSASLRLAPLADYGGPTQTMALRPGSPARDNAIPTPITTDQRGFPIVLGPKDSGAYEAGNYFLENYNVFAQEILPHTATDPERARTFDFDSDGTSNELEWLAVTGPANASSAFRPEMDTAGVIWFPTVIGRTYTLQRSDTLAPDSWVHADYSTPGDGTIRGFDPAFPAPGIARRFYRIVVTQP